MIRFSKRPGAWLLLAAMAALGAASAHAAGLDETKVRAFVARQERAWNANALDAYFAAFLPGAVFTDQYRTPAGEIVPYGSSSLTRARAQSRKFRATAKVAEAGEVVRIDFAPDGRSAQVISRVVSRTQGRNGLKIACAERRQDLVLDAGRVRSKGQTDTFSRCPRGVAAGR